MLCRILLADVHPHSDLIRGLVLLEERQLLLSASNDGTVAVSDIRSQGRTNFPAFVPYRNGCWCTGRWKSQSWSPGSNTVEQSVALHVIRTEWSLPPPQGAFIVQINFANLKHKVPSVRIVQE